MSDIILHTGQKVLIDEEDLKKLYLFIWYLHPGGSAHRRAIIDGKGKFILMHREIMEVTDPKIYVDHINHNPLDNRRKNLRLANHSQNAHNRSISQNNSSKFKGVTWHSTNLKWMASIRVDGTKKHIGYFYSEKEAALAYNKAARVYFGEYASLNILI